MKDKAMSGIEYWEVGPELLARMTEEIQRGESVVLLGARQMGKRYLIARVEEATWKQGGQVVRIDFLRDPPVMTETALRNLLTARVATARQRATGAAVEDFPLPAEMAGDACAESQADLPLFAPLDAMGTSRLLLLASNVDAMAHHLARRFLQEVRTRVQKGRLVVVLSGEDNLQHLVHGPNSEFECANQFVLQRFSRSGFRGLLDQLTPHWNIRLANDGVRDHLWELCGGNLLLVKLLLYAVFDYRTHFLRDEGQPVGVPDVDKARRVVQGQRIYLGDPLRAVVRVLDRDPVCWPLLERLLRGEPIAVAGQAPGSLELAGVALRDPHYLVFASPLMEDFIRRRYTPRRLGDLYARAGGWEEAFRRYEGLRPEETLRPTCMDDRGDVERLVQAAGAELHVRAPHGPEALRSFLARICRDLFGIAETSFWRYDSTWHLQNAQDLAFSAAERERLAGVLQGCSALPPGPVVVPCREEGLALVAVMPAVRFDRSEAVIVSKLADGVMFSYDEQHFLTTLLGHFVSACDQAAKTARTELRLTAARQHAEAIDAIFSALGSVGFDVRRALALAAQSLRRLGYKCVLFSLVDPTRTRIQGVLIDPPNPDVDYVALTDWPLTEPKADLQPYVVHTREPKLVPHVALEPLANPDVYRSAGVDAIAIIPMLDLEGETVGTIHVERTDGDVPGAHEIADLLRFGQQLAIAIEHVNRTNLLQSTVNGLSEPVVIFDSSRVCRFANRAAARAFAIDEGWRAPAKAENIAGLHDGKVTEYVDSAFLAPQGQTHFMAGFGQRPQSYGMAHADCIRDWRDRTIGVAFHIEDYDFVYQMLQALQLVAEATDFESAIDRTLAATRLLGHCWGRLYLIDPADRRFRSERGYGFKSAEVEAAFNRGEVCLSPQGEPDSESWLSTDRRAPVVFCTEPGIESGQELLSRYGVPMVNIQVPKCIEGLEKSPSELWLDFPLLAQGEPLGKITLACESDFLPQQFELLRVLAGMLGELLAVFQQRDAAARERVRWIQTAAENAMARTCHNLRARLAALPFMLSRYRELEGRCEELREVNHDFATILAGAMTTMGRIKECMIRPIPRFAPTNLGDLIERTLRSGLLDGQWEVTKGEPELVAEVDGHLLEGVLWEMVQNSKNAASPDRDLRVVVEVQVVVREGKELVRLTYRDNGPGVPPEYKTRIFEDFFSRRPGGKTGTGLGLAFARRAIEAHDGAIREGGEPGTGAFFVIELPRKHSQPLSQ